MSVCRRYANVFPWTFRYRIICEINILRLEKKKKGNIKKNKSTLKIYFQNKTRSNSTACGLEIKASAGKQRKREETRRKTRFQTSPLFVAREIPFGKPEEKLETRQIRAKVCPVLSGETLKASSPLKGEKEEDPVPALSAGICAGHRRCDRASTSYAFSTRRNEEKRRECSLGCC